MKYFSGDILYYTDPFIFTISKVYIDYILKEDNGEIFYIEDTGAYLKEQDLFQTLNEAKQDSINKLQKFYLRKMNEIIYGRADNEH